MDSGVLQRIGQGLLQGRRQYLLGHFRWVGQGKVTGARTCRDARPVYSHGNCPKLAVEVVVRRGVRKRIEVVSLGPAGIDLSFEVVPARERSATGFQREALE